MIVQSNNGRKQNSKENRNTTEIAAHSRRWDTNYRALDIIISMRCFSVTVTIGREPLNCATEWVIVVRRIFINYCVYNDDDIEIMIVICMLQVRTQLLCHINTTRV